MSEECEVCGGCGSCGKFEEEQVVSKMRSGFRKIHLGEKVWQYKVGRGYVNIYDPQNHRHNVRTSDITGETSDEIERGIFKGYWKGVRPSQIKQWIKAEVDHE